MIYPQQAELVYTANNIPVYVGAPGRTVGHLFYPATNTQGYKPGCLLARITSGVGEGRLVNYDPAGLLPGQDTCTNILIDPDLTTTIPSGDTFEGSLKVAVKNGNWIVRNIFLYATAVNLSDVAAGLADLGAAPDYINGELVYII